MEERKNKITFGQAGNGTGARITLSVPNLRKIGITPNERDVIVRYEDDKIIITKADK